MRNPALPLLLCAFCIVWSAGCFLLDERPAAAPVTSAVTTLPEPTTESIAVTLDPSDMALRLTDLPSGYIVRERGDIAYSDIDPLAREQGWTSGYLASFYRMNAEKYDLTAITQRIGVYRIDNMHALNRTMEEIFETAESGLRETENMSVTELPFPKTGEQSGAFRLVNASDQYGVTEYVVLFTKKNVIESVSMRGTTTDYELLKDLVETAADKVL